MNSWTLEPFGNLADFKNGLNFRAGETGHELKVLGVGDFKERTKLEQVADVSSIHTEKKIDKSYLLQDGDLVFVRSNGNPALVGRCMQIFTNNEDISFSGFTIRARLKTDKTTPELISLFMQGGLLKNILKRDGRGTNISNLNQDILSKLQIPIPSKAEQMELLSVFGCWDKAIEKTEALITAKEKQFEWLKSQLLLKNLKSEQWNISALGEFIVEEKAKSTTPNLYPCLTSSRRGIFLQEDYFSKQVASKDNSGYKIMSRGDFTFRSMSDDGIFVFNKQTIIDKGLISPAYGVFSPKKNMDSDFLYYFLNSPAFRRALSREVQGGTRTALKLNALKKLDVKIPCIQEQKHIASKLNIAKKEIDLVKELLEKYRSQKRGLMQKLLTGEWQVRSSQTLSEKTYQESSA